MTTATGVLETVIRPQFYLDSVALMRASRTLSNSDGVIDAAMMMATPANIAILENAALLDGTESEMSPGDLVISVRAATQEHAAAAHRLATELLSGPASGASSTDAAGNNAIRRPHSVQRAAEVHPSANLALISVPGPYAAAEARKAIRAGLHAMIFSDNVSLEAEIDLKQEARELGRLVMGPDCGTAIINQTPLAFANCVPTGRIGIVGASGTGIQEVSCLLAQAGQGISQAIGVGGRDLHERVGGVSTFMAIDALVSDKQTDHLILISKPPGKALVSRLLERLGDAGLPTTVCFLGIDRAALDTSSIPENVALVSTLKDAAEHAGQFSVPSQAESERTQLQTLSLDAGAKICGLYCGGTLCAEAQGVFRQKGLAVKSNAAIPGANALQPNELLDGDSHSVIDLGADEYTQGRPHPMIDPAVRTESLQSAMTNAAVGVILLDVVLGHGAHADPVGELLLCLPENLNSRNDKVVVASITGTDADPQGFAQQRARLQAVGVIVAPSNADAARLATQLVPT